MHHIGVLIDFTDLCTTSVSFAKTIAEKTGANITLIHVTETRGERHLAELDTKFSPYLADLKKAGLNAESYRAIGVFEKMIPELVTELEVDFVVVGTHGIKGIKQNLFGSNILKLAKSLPVSLLVVQKESAVTDASFRRIVLPVGPHHNFTGCILETAKLATAFNAEVLPYIVSKTDEGPGEIILQNKDQAEKYFAAHGIRYSAVTEDATVYSFGYAKQIIDFAKHNDTNLISVMAQVSSNLATLGDTDKENIILNKYAIPVLCINS